MKANKPETVEEILTTLVTRVAEENAEASGYAISTVIVDFLKVDEAKQSLKQLLLAGVPEEKTYTVQPNHNRIDNASRFYVGYEDGFNVCRYLLIDYINKITE